MRKDTLKLTTGAMFVAIFGMLLLINRQTGMMFEEMILYVLPIPMVAYSAQYGFKSGAPVMAAMILLALFMGNNITTIFYAGSEVLIGLVFGTCLNRKVDPMKTMLAVVMMSSLANVLNTIVFASLFGYNIPEEIAQMQEMMNQITAKAGLVFPESFFNTQFLMRMMIISMILLGIIQGYIIYAVSLMILKKLRFPVQKPQSIYMYCPPKWTGWIGMACVIAYLYVTAKQIGSENMQITIQTASMCSIVYFMAFGFIGVNFFCRRAFGLKRAVSMIIAIAVLLTFGQFNIMIGVLYIISDYHKKLLENPPDESNGMGSLAERLSGKGPGVYSQKEKMSIPKKMSIAEKSRMVQTRLSEKENDPDQTETSGQN